MREIEEIEGDFWVRLLYTHPAHWSDELIETIAECDKVARYIDMPLQHIDEAMLGRMRRETSRAHIEDLIVRLRAGIPGIALRTTFIVGFPGETEEEFESLLEFIERVRFERLGIFKYSQEEGSRAAKMPEQISNAQKNARYRRAMTLQQKIAREIAAEKVGLELKLLVDQPLHRPHGSRRARGRCPGYPLRRRRRWENSLGEKLSGRAVTIWWREIAQFSKPRLDFRRISHKISALTRPGRYPFYEGQNSWLTLGAPPDRHLPSQEKKGEVASKSYGRSERTKKRNGANHLTPAAHATTHRSGRKGHDAD